MSMVSEGTVAQHLCAMLQQLQLWICLNCNVMPKARGRSRIGLWLDAIEPITLMGLLSLGKSFGGLFTGGRG